MTPSIVLIIGVVLVVIFAIALKEIVVSIPAYAACMMGLMVGLLCISMGILAIFS